MTTQPNFVFIITDQQRADYLSCTGHPSLQTPNIDRIATHGTILERFYVANPVCMPNRASLMTGRMPSAHGVRSNGIPLSVQAHTFTDVLRAGGYRTALVGKSHLQNFTGLDAIQTRPASAGKDVLGDAQAQRPDAPEERYQLESPSAWRDPNFTVPTPFYGFDHVELCTAHGDRVGGDYRRWAQARGANLDALSGPKNSLAHDYRCPQAWRTAVPAELYPTQFVAERSTAYLTEHARAKTPSPFFLMVSFPDPHHPFTPPGRYWDLYNPAEMTLPESFFENADNPAPPLAWALRERVDGKATRDRGQFLFVVDEQEAREAIALTCGMIAFIDDAIGQVVDTLHRTGLADNTVIVFTSDHGDFLGDHRLLLKGPIHRQSLIRVPCIWHDPDTVGPPATGALASTVDLAPTVLDRAGLAPYHGMQGTSLLPILTGHANAEPATSVVVEDDQQRTVLGFDSSPRVHTLVTDRWRLSIYAETDWGELYDLSNDPLELRNVWAALEHQGDKARLIEQFLRREIALVDRSPLPSALA
ncbi:MAG: sulfatase-like hydrolase/transferase [Pseudomonadota bacterium]